MTIIATSPAQALRDFIETQLIDARSAKDAFARGWSRTYISGLLDAALLSGVFTPEEVTRYRKARDAALSSGRRCVQS